MVTNSLTCTSERINQIDQHNNIVLTPSHGLVSKFHSFVLEKVLNYNELSVFYALETHLETHLIGN